MAMGSPFGVEAQPEIGSALAVVDGHLQAFLIQHLPYKVAIKKDRVGIPSAR